ncbi:MAG: EMC3/TMCO1 family protein [Candidatus Thermoplasmatota archaeon]
MGKEAGGDSSALLLLFMLPIVFLIIFDPVLRTSAGSAMGYILWPTIGFNALYPLWTIFFAALIMVALSTTLTHIFTDWFAVGKAKLFSSHYQGELRKAYKEGNIAKIKKLTELQPEIMKMNMQNFSSQMRVMVVTMIIAIAIFMWLPIFINSYVPGNKTISAPWDTSCSLVVTGPIFHITPIWIFVYILFSIPLGRICQGILKLITYSRYDKVIK